MRFARLTSARRRLRGRSGLGWTVILSLLAALAGLLAWVELRDEPEAVGRPAAATTRAVRRAPTPTPPATPAATPTREPFLQRTTWVDLTAASPSPTPTPTPTAEPSPTPTERPEPPPCIQATWTATQGLGRLGEVLVEIEVLNRCDHDLQPLDVWFEATGYRGGEEVQSVCGHPFFTVRRNHSERVALGLPGSLDWYDRVEVALVGPGCR